jgi:hypothetical protein
MSKFKVYTEVTANANGTSLKGYVKANYNQLLSLLGEPTYDTPSGDNKVQKEWVVGFKGEIFTIYDWKTYNEFETMNTLNEFNVGGTTNASEFIEFIEKSIKNN